MAVLGIADDNETFRIANVIGPLSYAALCLFAVVAMLRRGYIEVWSPLVPFLAVSGIAFGFGPLTYYFGSDELLNYIEIAYQPNAFEILRTNLLNALGGFFVVLGYQLGSKVARRISFPAQPPLLIGDIYRLFIFLFLIAVPVKYFVYLPYIFGFGAESLPGIVLSISKLTLICIFLAAYLATKFRRSFWLMTVALVTAEAAVALPTFGKAEFTLPFVMAAVGAFYGRPERSVVLASLATFVLALSFILPLSSTARSLGIPYQPFDERIAFIADYVSGHVEPTQQSLTGLEQMWVRQTFSPVEAFLMNQYDEGLPGNSFRNVFAVFIPRALWTDKPIITNLGIELNEMVFGANTSSLAPTIFADTYWNGGWGLVVCVALFVGVVFSVMANRSKGYLARGELRYLPIALMGLMYGASVESAFVTTFMGALPIMIATWIGIRILTSTR
jgi:hypothetical protein